MRSILILLQLNATATYVDYDDDRITIQEWDIGRQEYRDAADIIEKNAAWIAEEAVGRLKLRYPDFVFPAITLLQILTVAQTIVFVTLETTSFLRWSKTSEMVVITM